MLGKSKLQAQEQAWLPGNRRNTSGLRDSAKEERRQRQAGSLQAPCQPRIGTQTSVCRTVGNSGEVESRRGT